MAAPDPVARHAVALSVSMSAGLAKEDAVATASCCPWCGGRGAGAGSGRTHRRRLLRRNALNILRARPLFAPPPPGLLPPGLETKVEEYTDEQNVTKFVAPGEQAKHCELAAQHSEPACVHIDTEDLPSFDRIEERGNASPSEACLRQAGMNANAVGESVAPGMQASVPSCEGSFTTGTNHESKRCEPAAHYCEHTFVHSDTEEDEESFTTVTDLEFMDCETAAQHSEPTCVHTDTEELPSFDHRCESAPFASDLSVIEERAEAPPSETSLRQVDMNANAVGEFVAPGMRASVPSCEGRLSTGTDHESKHCEPAAQLCEPTFVHSDTEDDEGSLTTGTYHTFVHSDTEDEEGPSEAWQHQSLPPHLRTCAFSDSCDSPRYRDESRIDSRLRFFTFDEWVQLLPCSRRHCDDAQAMIDLLLEFGSDDLL